MKKILNKNKAIITTSLFTVIIAFIIGFSPINDANRTSQAAAPAVTKAAITKQTTTNSIEVAATPMMLVCNPQNYLNRNVRFRATFDKFSGLGLDYKPALKSSQDYIGILIKRDDVINHTIPLSELKMFLKRKEAEKHIDIESGDKIEIHGKVFSTALGDPWLEINKFIVLTKKEKKAATK